jgi:hypothetical protein
VAVFDFFNVLTSNGGTPNLNDVGRATGNHHRFRDAATEHLQGLANNFSSYGSDPYDSHPTAKGGQKAGTEFVPLLNLFYRRWKGYPLNPQANSVSPSAGSIPSGQMKNVETAWSDPNGRSELKETFFEIGSSLTEANTALMKYDPIQNRVYLRSQDGTSWQGGFAPGASQAVSNSQITLHGGPTRVFREGDSIRVRWAVTLSSSYKGVKNLYSKAIDTTGRNSGWRKRGSLTID